MQRKFLCIALMILMLFITSCKNTKPIKESRFLLDTIIEITLYENNKASKAMLNDMFNLIKNSEEKYSRYITGSEISKINNNPGKPTPVSSDTMEMIEKSIYYSSISDGLFDISIGPLIDLWNINGDNPRVPSQNEIESVLDKIDYRKIMMDRENSTVFLADNGMSLDTGAIAKGYITDLLVTYLREKDINSALINLGGNLYLYGSKIDGSPWNIGIRNPFGLKGEYFGTVSVKNISIVTSGIYERFFEHEQIIYHHILNPKTGYPENNNLASVSILSPSSTVADCLSTTVFLLGLEKGLSVVESIDGVEAIIITRDKKVHLSSGIKSGEIPFKLTNSEFTVTD
jgi:thiamine biosynthesis lipoprotein